MRVKRFIAILLMTLANVFILVHAVVPHFHHDGIVCFDSTTRPTCNTYNIDFGDSCCCMEIATEDAHHGHLEHCNLSQIVERNGDPTDDSIIVKPTVTTDLICVCALHCYSLLSLVDLTSFTLEEYKPYLNTYNLPYVGSTFGLRAPPAPAFSLL